MIALKPIAKELVNFTTMAYMGNFGGQIFSKSLLMKQLVQSISYSTVYILVRKLW